MNPKLAPAPITVASFTAAMLMVLVTPVLVCAPTLSLFASVTNQVTVRLLRAFATVGSSLVLR